MVDNLVPNTINRCRSYFGTNLELANSLLFLANVSELHNHLFFKNLVKWQQDFSKSRQMATRFFKTETKEKTNRLENA